MTLRVSGKNMSIGDALRQHVTDRLEGATARYIEGSLIGHVTIAPEGSGFRSDCALHLKSGVTLQADGRAHDPYASFDQAAGRIEKRLRRHKERLKGHHPHTAPPVGAAQENVSTYVLEAFDEDADAPPAEGYSPAVIAETTSHLTRLSVSSALAELDLTGAAAFAFRHEVSERVNVLYRRPDGNVGWIDIGAESRDAVTAKTKVA